MIRKMSVLQRLMLLKMASGGGSLTEYTATGNPATFNTNVSKPLTGLTIPFTPVQEGEGDPSPENIRPITGWTVVNVTRSGINLLDPNAERTKGNFTENGNIGSASNTYVFGVPCKPNTTYTLYTSGAGGNLTYRVGLTKSYPKQGVYCEFLATRTQANGPYSIYTGDNSFIAFATTATVERVSGTMLILGNSTDEEYSPYVGTTIPITFKENLFDKDDPTTIAKAYLEASTGKYIVSNLTTRMIMIPCEPSTTYTVSNGVTTTMRVASFSHIPSNNDSPTAYNSPTNATTAGTGLTITTGENDAYLYVQVFANGDTGMDITTATDSLMIEIGSSVLDGIVYGGTLDLTTGVLTVEYEGISTTWGDMAKGTVNPTTGYVGGYKNFVNPVLYPGGGASSSNSFCNVGKFVWDGAGTAVPHFYPGKSSGIHRAEVYLPNDTDGSTSIQVVGKLIDPLEFHITPQQLSTLIGDNVIFSDTNGENTVKYLKRG